MRNRYFITYDITDDKRRNSVYKVLLGNGDHVQYSAFICELNNLELQRVKGLLASHINMRQDQILILKMGVAKKTIDEKMETIGKAYIPPVRVLVV